VRSGRDVEHGGRRPAFRPPGAILWDPWFLAYRGEYHAFYLQVPVLEDPEQRHHDAVEIGHAVSEDLHRWRERPVALRPGPAGAWDSLALWTGCAVHDGTRFHLFYTGRCSSEFWLQRIGVAVSQDLDRWEKEPAFRLDPEPGHYSATASLNELGVPPAWRDPWVFRDPQTGLWYMTLSARTASERPHNACVALARSDDLRQWEVLPPLLTPGVYDEMELPQPIHHDGRWYLFFSTRGIHYRADWAGRHGRCSGLHCYVADDLLGEYRPVNGNGVVLDDADRRYGVRLVKRDGDDYIAVGWLDYDSGRFVGAIGEPLRLRLEGDRVRALE
jgi:beta-fructofuranosidase